MPCKPPCPHCGAMATSVESEPHVRYDTLTARCAICGWLSYSEASKQDLCPVCKLRPRKPGNVTCGRSCAAKTTLRNMPQKIIAKGRDAALQGLSESDNPYVGVSAYSCKHHADWLRGFNSV